VLIARFAVGGHVEEEERQRGRVSRVLSPER